MCIGPVNCHLGCQWLRDGAGAGPRFGAVPREGVSSAELDGAVSDGQAGASPHLRAARSPQDWNTHRSVREPRPEEGPAEDQETDGHARCLQDAQDSSHVLLFVVTDQWACQGWGGDQRRQLSSGPWPLQGHHHLTPSAPRASLSQGLHVTGAKPSAPLWDWLKEGRAKYAGSEALAWLESPSSEGRGEERKPGTHPSEATVPGRQVLAPGRAGEGMCSLGQDRRRGSLGPRTHILGR